MGVCFFSFPAFFFTFTTCYRWLTLAIHVVTANPAIENYSSTKNRQKLSFISFKALSVRPPCRAQQFFKLMVVLFHPSSPTGKYAFWWVSRMSTISLRMYKTSSSHETRVTNWTPTPFRGSCPDVLGIAGENLTHSTPSHEQSGKVRTTHRSQKLQTVLVADFKLHPAPNGTTLADWRVVCCACVQRNMLKFFMDYECIK